MIYQIFAKSENDVIGNNNELPWNLPKDLRFFKSKTHGHPVIMGRKTFESLGKALPGRLNVVVTSDKNYNAPGCTVVQSIEEGVHAAEKAGDPDIFIIGGAKIFSESIPLTDRVFLTEIKARVEGNIQYHFSKKGWKEIWREDHHKDEKHAYDFSFIELAKE